MYFPLVAKTAVVIWLAGLFPVSRLLVSASAQDLSSKVKPETATESEIVFPDVPPGHWARSAVERDSVFGIVEGTPKRNYEGDRPLTRGELVVLMARFPTNLRSSLMVPPLTKRDIDRTSAPMLPADGKGGKDFSDVPRTHWIYPALRYMSQYGIIKGLPDGRLGVNAPVSRYDYAVALERMVGFVDNDSYYYEQLENPQAAEPPWKADKSVTFKDLPSNHRAYRAVIRLASAGVFQWGEGNNFQGSKPITRYEFAVSMSRLLDLQGPPGE